MGKIKKGLILGGLLAGIFAGLTMTKKGKELTKDLQKEFKSMAKDLKKRLSGLEDLSKEKFDATVAMIVEEYGKKKALAMDAKKSLASALEDLWEEEKEVPCQCHCGQKHGKK